MPIQDDTLPPRGIYRVKRSGSPSLLRLHFIDTRNNSHSHRMQAVNSTTSAAAFIIVASSQAGSWCGEHPHWHTFGRQVGGSVTVSRSVASGVSALKVGTLLEATAPTVGGFG